MGSPASVVLIEITMKDIEKKILVNTLYHALSWKRYLDNCYSTVRNDVNNDILIYINSINENIRFTNEKEEHGKLPLLDRTIIRNDSGTLYFKVYGKPTSNEILRL